MQLYLTTEILAYPCSLPFYSQYPGNRKQPRYLPTQEWIMQMWYPYIAEHYSVVKEK